MIYQRTIPDQELFSAQLELLMQNARVATLSAHVGGIIATVALFWAFLDWQLLASWGAGFVVLLLLRSLHMSNVLVERRFDSNPRVVYWQLILGACLTGACWSLAFLYVAPLVPELNLYVFLVMIISIVAFSIGVTVVIREYFIAYLFTSLWPIAWWCLVHYQDQAYNLLLGLFLLMLVAVLVAVCNRIYLSYQSMIALNWERETMSRELGSITTSLRQRNQQLREARRQLTDLANVDELTGLGNRRMVNSVLQAEINRARRTGSPLSIIMVDVDYFKNYNDTYGHPAGDEVLQQLADLMQQATSRAGELVGRFGGEEFILVLPGASSDDAQRTAERLRGLVVEQAIPHSGSRVADVVTISQGVSTVTPDSDLAPEELVQRADEALYEAKFAGRNTVTVN